METKIKAEQVPVIFEKKGAGQSIASIAKEFGVSISCIRRIVYDGGRSAPKNRTPNDEKIAALYDQGLSYLTICERLGIKPLAVRGALKRMNRERRATRA